MKRFLLFKARDLCYGSILYFTDCFAKELREAGHEVEVCEFTKDTVDLLEKYQGKSYDAMIDFNSLLPTARLDDGSYFLDTVEGAFYNYLLDHPLYHHTPLNEKIKDYHVICLDYDHVSYVKEFYPHVKSVHMLPLGAMKRENIKQDAERRYDVLFTGTYTNPEALEEILASCAKEIQVNVSAMVKQLQKEQKEPVAKVMEKTLFELGYKPKKENLPAIMNLHFLADTYVRAKERHDIVLSLLEEDVPVTVLGHGWDKFSAKHNKNLTILSSVKFEETFSYMEKSNILLNVHPLFRAGAHDRVFNAMLCKTVCLTNSSSYMDGILKDGQDVLFYDVSKPKECARKAKEYLANPLKLEQIRANALTKAEKEFTFANRVQTFLTYLEEK